MSCGRAYNVRYSIFKMGESRKMKTFQQSLRNTIAMFPRSTLYTATGPLTLGIGPALAPYTVKSPRVWDSVATAKARMIEYLDLSERVDLALEALDPWSCPPHCECNGGS